MRNRRRRGWAPRVAACVLGVAMGAWGQEGESGRTILAVGAHAGDMEVSAGAVLARHARRGDKVVLLHLSLGEAGHPGRTREDYGAQKRREAEEAARVLGAEVEFGPWRDGMVPATEEAAKWVAEVIWRVKPTHVITHPKHSIHKDHESAHRVVREAVLLASLAAEAGQRAAHRGIRALLYAENWEDAEGFTPYLYVDVSEEMEVWRECVRKYEFIRGGVVAFPYLDYYEALARMRGALSGKRQAVAFDVDAAAKRRVLNALP